MPEGVIQSFGVQNYSGALFNKGNTKTPLSSIIGSRLKTTNHVEFVTGQFYTTAGGEQPAISETASLTAPAPKFVTREQLTNVTQIFQKAVAISYAKQSNMGTLAGVNIANQTANPLTELDHQVGAMMVELSRDIEYTFINGVYAKATTDVTANKTRGLNTAITTNTKAMASKPLTFWAVAELLRAIYDAQAPINDVVLWCDATTMFQLNADAKANGLTVIPNGRTVNGIAIDTLITPLGTIGIKLGEFIPKGTAFLINMSVLAPVIQPVPGRGNFFLEPLAKTGAGESYHLFGQVGLDHGPEYYHAKFTGISQTFTAPTNTPITP